MSTWLKCLHQLKRMSTWLKCSHQLKGMSTLTRSLRHEKHMGFLLVILIKVNFLTKCQFEHLVKWDPPPQGNKNGKGPIKLALLNYHYGMLLIHVWSHGDYLATCVYHESIWFLLDYMLSHDMLLTYFTLCTLAKTYLPNLFTYHTYHI